MESIYKEKYQKFKSYFFDQKKKFNQGRKITPLDYTPSQVELLKSCKNKQLVILDKVRIALITLPNGLSYKGVMAMEDIQPNEIFMSMPEEMILHTKKVFYSEINYIFKENYLDFFMTKENNIRDYPIFIVYLIYQLKKGTNSEIYHFIQTFPKDYNNVDIFFSEKQIERFQDERFTQIAHFHKKFFEEFYQKVKLVLSHYPQVFSPDDYSQEKVAYAYNSINTRCFGNYQGNIAMIPFLDMINCDDVHTLFQPQCNYQYYDLAKLEKYEKNKIPEDQRSEKTNFSGDVEEECYTTEFKDIFEINPQILLIEGKDVNYQQFIKKLQEFTPCQMYSNYIGFYVSFFTKIENLIKQYENQQLDQKSYSQQLAQLDELHREYQRQANEAWKQQKKQLFQQNKQTDFDYYLKEESLEEENTSINIDNWNLDTSQPFQYKTGPQQQFKAGDEIFISYGRYDNHYFIHYYGFCYPFNLYDFVIIKVDVFKEVQDRKQNPLLLQNCKNLPKWMNFKIKYRRFNIDILAFIKSLEWQFDDNSQSIVNLFQPKDLKLELSALIKLQKVYEQYLSKNFKESFSENLAISQKLNIDYIEYMAAIYRLERQRIIMNQINLVKICIFYIQKMIEQNIIIKIWPQLQDIEDSQQQYEMNRFLLHKYINNF